MGYLSERQQRRKDWGAYTTLCSFQGDPKGQSGQCSKEESKVSPHSLQRGRAGEPGERAWAQIVVDGNGLPSCACL